MLRQISPEESIAQDEKLLDKLREALAERTDNGYPKNLHLSNLLWKVLALWEDTG